MTEIISLSGVSQWGGLAIIAGVIIWWIRGIAERTRAKTDGAVSIAKIEADLREAVAEQVTALRKEVHFIRNELAVVRAELHVTAAKSMRRGDKLNMVLFILRMVMDELRAKEPKNKVLAQAHLLLARVEDEPHALDNSDALEAAETTVDAANAAVREVKAEEARK